MKYKIETSNIESVEWDDGYLTVSFHDGSAWTYSGVPSGLAEGMQSALSAGSYFNRHIVGRYKYLSGSGSNKEDQAKQLHHIASTVGLWATDQPDLIPRDLKDSVFFQIEY